MMCRTVELSRFVGTLEKPKAIAAHLKGEEMPGVSLGELEPQLRAGAINLGTRSQSDPSVAPS